VNKNLQTYIFLEHSLFVYDLPFPKGGALNRSPGSKGFRQGGQG